MFASVARAVTNSSVPSSMVGVTWSFTNAAEMPVKFVLGVLLKVLAPKLATKVALSLQCTHGRYLPPLAVDWVKL